MTDQTPTPEQRAEQAEAERDRYRTAWRSAREGREAERSRAETAEHRADLNRRAWDEYHLMKQRAEQAEAVVALARSRHQRAPSGDCTGCFVTWPCPIICHLDGSQPCSPGCEDRHVPLDTPQES